MRQVAYPCARLRAVLRPAASLGPAPAHTTAAWTPPPEAGAGPTPQHLVLGQHFSSTANGGAAAAATGATAAAAAARLNTTVEASASPHVRAATASETPAPLAANPVVQRYEALLRSGTLHADPAQAALVRRLAALYDEICSYNARMDQHHAAVADYQARRVARLQELLAAEQQERERERERVRERERGQRSSAGALAAAASSSPAPDGAAGGSWGSWLRSALGLSGHHQHVHQQQQHGSTPLQRERLAAVRREERVAAELGPPPAAPQPPKGLYVWGSVGSGKSMLVALLYQALQETARLPAARWMHFNAAMLEIHSRLHYLDVERWRQRELSYQRHAATRQQQQQHDQKHQQQQQPQHKQQWPIAAAASAAGHARGQQRYDSTTAELLAYEGSLEHQVGLGVGVEGEEEDEVAEREQARRRAEAEALAKKCGGGGAAALAAAAESGQVAGAGGAGGPGAVGGDEGDETLVSTSPERQGVLRYWDPEVGRQREAKAAMLAIRRHMRLARAGRNGPSNLAAGNAQGLVRMASAFIRGRPGEPLSGWAGGTGPLASVLYFDEVQVTDVFSAVALKGLVEALTSAGCVLLCTSNRAPGDLPRHGLHEDVWAHFIQTLVGRCEVHELSSPEDYRRMLLEEGRAAIARGAAAAADLATGSTTPEATWASAGAGAPATASGTGGAHASAAASAAGAALWPPLSCSYFHGSEAEAQAAMEALWAACHGGQGGHSSTSVPVMFGRTLEVARASPTHGSGSAAATAATAAGGAAAWFRFEELCARTLGPADFVALAQNFHTLFLTHIPPMSMNVRDQARRFITLVDELYNARCLLVAAAAVPPDQLFAGAEGQEPILDLEGLQFETAVEGARLRRDATSSGGVAPVAATPAALTAAMGALGGAEERFAFRRAVSRLYEMQSPQYIRTALRMRQGIVGTGTIDGDAGTTALGQELGVAVNTPVGQQ